MTHHEILFRSLEDQLAKMDVILYILDEILDNITQIAASNKPSSRSDDPDETVNEEYTALFPVDPVGENENSSREKPLLHDHTLDGHVKPRNDIHSRSGSIKQFASPQLKDDSQALAMKKKILEQAEELDKETDEIEDHRQYPVRLSPIQNCSSKSQVIVNEILEQDIIENGVLAFNRLLHAKNACDEDNEQKAAGEGENDQKPAEMGEDERSEIQKTKELNSGCESSFEDVIVIDDTENCDSSTTPEKNALSLIVETKINSTTSNLPNEAAAKDLFTSSEEVVIIDDTVKLPYHEGTKIKPNVATPATTLIEKTEKISAVTYFPPRYDFKEGRNMKTKKIQNQEMETKAHAKASFIVHAVVVHHVIISSKWI